MLDEKSGKIKWKGKESVIMNMGGRKLFKLCVV